jgi:dTDP-4-dehydrorhamnose 3,5-epimerase
MIEGVKITNLKKIEDYRGSVLPMLRSDSKVFQSFGEIYFSTIFDNSIKAWHLHKKAVLNYVCIKGKVKLVLFDDRNESGSYGKYSEYILTPNNYFLITIPPFIWNGFKGLDKSESIVANCINLPHDENEMVRKDHDDKYFKYNWKR